MLMNALTDGNRVATRNAAATVRHYVPGGFENGGGIGRLVGYISNTAKEAGETHLVTDTRGPRWSSVASPVRLLGAVLMMAKDRIIAPARIHHIHVAGRGSTARKLILTEAARLLGCSHILHLHDYDYATDFAARSPRQQMLVRRMFQHADQVVALGQRDRMTLTTLLGVEERRVVVIGNCVPDPGPRNVHVGEMPLIIFLGRLSERKGVQELLLALSHPIMKELRWRAVLAGDGPVEDYRRQAAAMGLSDLVKMPGWLGADEAQALCTRADILVLPSHAEGLAMAVVEGLAHGLAVVTTRVGAHGEVISDGETGVFVPVGDKDALAAALAKLVTDPEVRNYLSAKARAHYLNNFSMKAYMRSLDKLYDAISAQPQTTAGER
ncbi:glycosyltransferase family 4 protein [Rhizobium laguerreae]|uniref:glycosyltransferase family 4 protein n=1 Tax=Rhizobium laguerreae TaxID=1076926 RepID=UPI001C91198E|nr:glycosyltransferase family 4 protein [Rhizobium laguerreae]MBY3341741.1 glycosyltransferase family 4 protein [Rhizobium laguerreae]